MNKPTKEQALLLRVFKVIELHHFLDHKMVRHYVGTGFPRQLGNEIGNYIQSHFGKHYNARKTRHTSKNGPAPSV